MLAHLLLALVVPVLAQTSTDASMSQDVATPAATSSGASASAQAGESPLTETRVNYPTSLDWWVVGAHNQAQWTFVHPDKNAEDVSMDLVLNNLNDTLCPQPVKMATVRAVWGKWGATSQFEGAQPGQGYFIILQDSSDESQVYSESENFELKPAGAAPVNGGDPAASSAASSGAPADNAAASSAPAGSDPAASAPQASATPGATSGAGRIAPAGWLVGAAVAAAVL